MKSRCPRPLFPVGVCECVCVCVCVGGGVTNDRCIRNFKFLENMRQKKKTLINPGPLYFEKVFLFFG